MDIRIGNDVCIQIPVSEFGDINVEDIKRMKCTFIKTRDVCPCGNNSHPVFHHSTQYTIRSCGHPSYYAYPCNTRGYCMNEDPHCGFVVCDDDKHSCIFKSRCKITGQFINAYFPAEFQKCLGTYKCIFEIKVAEDGWDYDNLHTYSTSYEELFTLKETGQTGSIVIRPRNIEKFDTYLSILSDTELQKYQNNYSEIILKSEGFKLTRLPDSTKEITISGTKKRIVIISSYNSLQLVFNSYMFPVTMYELEKDKYYLYISDYTYSDVTFDLQLFDSGESNPITPILPDIPDDPTEPDVPDEPTLENKLDGTTLKIMSGTLDDGTLSLSGNITNYTLIV